MGYFTWTFADSKHGKKLPYDSACYVACPDGRFLKERCYDGYGKFDGRDVYELVVDWNKDHLVEIFDRMAEKDKTFWGHEMRPVAVAYQEGGLDEACKEVHRLINTGKLCSGEMTEWKRTIGITIACADEDNAALPYPIKIVQTMTIPYDRLPSSRSTQ